ncbi:MAG TPA: glutamate--tRNA ligase [Acidimicrobiia bacterium]|nr:glutamate--tRNA ligase [Acidimicrobiia bacterium]
MTVRVRVAPSPTGNLHVGTARAALYNWLYARHTGGTFIVRVDDTDVARSTPEFESNILASLRWLGLDWDEGVEIGGSHGDYRQSSRFDRYRQVAHQLVAEGAAYFDDRSSDELDILRTRAQQEGKHPGHYIRPPDEPRSEGVIRFAANQAVEFQDLIRGDMRFDGDSIDDFVILRSDGTPTYHLASTVDDVDYGITHVARGEDLLSSTPKHILITRAMSVEPPVYAHLPLLFGADGKKLSKRHGATAVDEFRQMGFLPDAMVNYLALLGWSPGDDLTVFDRQLAVDRFDLSDVQKNPAVFDLDKLTWLNGEYIRAMDPAEFAAEVRPLVEDAVGSLTDEKWAAFEALAPLVQERTKLLPEAADQARFLYVDDLEYDEQSWNKVMDREGVSEVLDASLAALTALDEWDTESIEATLRRLPDRLERGAGKVFQPIRVAVTGSSVSPPLFESVAALGRNPSLERLREARRRL